MNDKILNQIRIMDLSRVLAGPWATQLLADYGAEIIKIEHPIDGDSTRKWGPPWNKNDDQRNASYFYSANRGKLSLTCDLKSTEGQSIIKDLAKHCDVVVENFKYGTMDKYGLSIEQLREINPNLIYCSITAYANNSSLKNEVGYDAMIQASAGLMSITGEKKGKPQKVGVAIADIMTGMYAASAILASLYQRSNSGVAQDINVPLYDSQVAWLANQNMNFLMSNEVPKKNGNAHPNIAPYQMFTTSDGDIMVAVGSNDQFLKFMKCIGCDEKKILENFKNNEQRVENIDKLDGIISKLIIKNTTSFWLNELKKNHIPCGPINNISEVFKSDYANEMGFVCYGQNSTDKRVPTVKNPVNFSKHEISYNQASPNHGEHKYDILRNLLGYTEDDIIDLENKKVI
tara:strand:+ start:2533 stop:3738 length:1206 start_codon:yes stop_codon:yes gene_type:complete